MRSAAAVATSTFLLLAVAIQQAACKKPPVGAPKDAAAATQPTDRRTRVHDLFVVPTIVFQVSHGNVVGQATGFFYSAHGVVYFVTNRHVVDPRFGNPSASVEVDALRLRLHVAAENLVPSRTIDLPLKRNGQSLSHFHRLPEVDVAVVEVDQGIRRHAFLKWITSENFVPQNLSLTAGEDVMVFGYPLSFYDTPHNLPIVRKGMVASAYGVNFQDLPLFLIDANLHPGMSGGPVFTKPTNVSTTTNGNVTFDARQSQFFLGIQSSVRVAVLDRERVSNLGLCNVWYARTIDEIVSDIIGPR